jgi:hypothetical protein
MDTFIISFFNLKQTDYQYNKYTKVEDIPTQEYIHDKLLCNIIESYKIENLNETIYRITFKNDYIAALAFDIYKYTKHGQYAHLNFIRSVPYKPIESLKKPILTPVEILNMYEKELDHDYMIEIGKQYYNTETYCYKKYRLEDGIIIADMICKEELLQTCGGTYKSCLKCVDCDCEQIELDNMCCYVSNNDKEFSTTNILRQIMECDDDGDHTNTHNNDIQPVEKNNINGYQEQISSILHTMEPSDKKIMYICSLLDKYIAQEQNDFKILYIELIKDQLHLLKNLKM